MLRYVEAVEDAIRTRNWYAALGIALTLPDICASIEDPTAKGFEARYVNWYDRYLLSTHTGFVGPKRRKVVFLSGADCFALRCAFLHEGTSETTPKPQRVLQRFRFTRPRADGSGGSHMNMLNGVMLQLSVDIFCQDVCNAVRAWIESVKGDEVIQSRMQGTLLVIEGQDDGFSII